MRPPQVSQIKVPAAILVRRAVSVYCYGAEFKQRRWNPRSAFSAVTSGIAASMLKCAFCDLDCVPTREHVIPDWFRSRFPDYDVFNVRRPTTHRHGSMVVKDVCAKCNNVTLGELDGYGKELYTKYFSDPAFLGEPIKFDVDRSRLARWLTKLCYNSGRVHNADVTILRKYRRFVLGADPLPEPLVYVHLVTATDFSTSPPSPARRIFGDHHDVQAVRWFRLTQYRRRNRPLTDVVQRQIYIDSYCFTLFATDPDNHEHPDELAAIESHFRQFVPNAVPIPQNGAIVLTPGGLHSLLTITQHMNNYPARYSDGPRSEDNDIAEAIDLLVAGDVGLLNVKITREDVEAGEIAGVARALGELVANRESALASMQRVALFIDGYNDDPRELWKIPEASQFLRRLFAACPHLFFLASPYAGTTGLLACCCCAIVAEPGDARCEFDRADLRRFLEAGFHGLNEVTQRFAISVEINRRISDDVSGMFSGSQ